MLGDIQKRENAEILVWKMTKRKQTKLLDVNFIDDRNKTKRKRWNVKLVDDRNKTKRKRWNVNLVDDRNKTNENAELLIK